MANRISVNTTRNEVNVTPNQNVVTVNESSGNVTVTEPRTGIITVKAPGPSGPAGKDGISGPTFALNTILEYLNTNVTIESNNIQSDTTFRLDGATFLSVPSGFPALTKFNFQYFINGILIPPKNVTSISQNLNPSPFNDGFDAGFGVDPGPFTEVVFNTDLLGFTLESGDTVVVIGKFNPSSYSSGFSNGFGYFTGDFVSETSTLILT
jgi:hypothetical protein